MTPTKRAPTGAARLASLKDKARDQDRPLQVPRGDTQGTGAQNLMEGGFKGQLKRAEDERDQYRRERDDALGEVAKLQQQMQQKLAGDPNAAVQMLDTSQLKPSRFYNRTASSTNPSNPAMVDLIAKVRAVGGNVEPILVRPASDSAGYEICFGFRRVAACEFLGLPVKAIIASLSDVEMLRYRLVENLAREDLSPWAKARQVIELISEHERRAQDEGRERHDHEALRLGDMGFHRSHIHRMRRIADLPIVLEQLHPDIDSLQYRTFALIIEAYELDREGFLARAKKAQAKKLGARETTAYWLQQRDTEPKASLRVTAKGLQVFIPCTPEVGEQLKELLRRKAIELNVLEDDASADPQPEAGAS